MAALVVTACGGDSSGGVASAPVVQATIGAPIKQVTTADGYQFKDLNGNGKLDAHEDWRLSPQDRANDLVAQMTLAEKAGLVNASNIMPIGGNYSATEIGGAPSCAAGETGKSTFARSPAGPVQRVSGVRPG